MPSLIDIPYEGQTVDGWDDATLVARVLQGEPEAFGPIIERYKDAVFGVALSRLRNFHDAEDLTQTTFVEAFGRLDRLKESGHLGPWLRTITINRCINFLKRQDRIVNFETIEEPVSEKPSPEIDLEKTELREQVMEAVGRLSKTQRETVTLYYISEYSLTEVATIQAVPFFQKTNATPFWRRIIKRNNISRYFASVVPIFELSGLTSKERVLGTTTRSISSI